MESIDSVLKEKLLKMDATALAEWIKNRKVTSSEVVSIYIEHQKKVNPSINAVVEDRYELALKEAKSLDEKRHTLKQLPPLYGVPITVKESLHVAGMKTTSGLEHRQDLISREDAPAITRLQNAGAIILGKTNTPALCFNQETDNRLYGRTNNPWDLTRTAGGSSGGEGAILAAGGSPAGIGSDIGGSIRFPAHFNGVIGFKPGMYRGSSAGHYPSATTPLQERMLTIGPMGRSVRDMELLYSVLSPHSTANRYLQFFKIEVLPGTVNYPLSEKTIEMMDNIEKFLTESFSTNRFIPPYFEESSLLWLEMLASEGSELIEKSAFHNDRSNLVKAFLREKITNRASVDPYLTMGILGSKLFRPSKSRVKEIKKTLAEGDDFLSEYLHNRLLLFPVYHTSALKHGKVYKEIFSLRRTFLNFMPFIAYANVWGLPSLTVPIRNDENNMPISIQVISANGNEDAIFRLGKILEKKFRGYVAAQPTD
ncbi:glutamyl-tRNA(Gln) amidotransferase subunit A [Oceanobacillus picturae]|uniref:Glutamyl-tRNA(Gln) amidotransferase subunit A n=1 Tax=Oceanobacillus picturae TaxID=171693 RepID=W9AJK2_9BACI|nr:amidase [Oceanobacillus picturae]GAQ16227.1 glutamyl-tRNA(Gln) amidotransferase subunit A [Oceanobacillus picturae]CDO03062.1 Glutamyl-tRNA(Gln) amidotransferase subunit A [Oceanobacillus picturae]